MIRKEFEELKRSLNKVVHLTPDQVREIKKIMYKIKVICLCCILFSSCRVIEYPVKCYDPADVCTWDIKAPGNYFHHHDNYIIWNGRTIYVVLDCYNGTEGWYSYFVTEPGPIRYMAVDFKERSVTTAETAMFTNIHVYTESK